MKKLLVAVLACALFAPAFAVENVYVTGDIQTIGLKLESNVAGADRQYTSNRVLLGLGADLVEDVQAKLTFAHRWFNGENDTTGESINNIWNNSFLAEAYVNITNVFDALEVKVGRQFYGDEKSAVMYFGPDYGYAVGNDYTSLDGVTATYNGENLIATAAYFSLRNGAPYGDGDHENLAGLDLTYKFSKAVAASAYVYDVRRESVWNQGFWGVKPTIETENFKLGAEFARNYGDFEKGWLVKADLALPMGTDDFSFTPRLTYVKTEKNFRAYGNYRPGLWFGTVLGVVDRIPFAVGAPTDWEIINAGVCLKFANLEKWGFGLDFYTGEFDIGAKTDSFEGNSWEAKVVYNHNDYVAFNLTGAVLTNVKHFTASPTAVQLGMNIKF